MPEMIATVYTCDRCGLKTPSDEIPDYWRRLSVHQNGPQPLKPPTVDLCAHCRKEFDEWLKHTDVRLPAGVAII